MAPRLPTVGRGIANRVRNPWQVPTAGLESLPAGAAIVACNRSGGFDHVQVAYSLGRPATVLVEPEAGLAPWPTLRRTSWAQAGRPDGPAEVLMRGGLLVIFPEIFVPGDGAVHKGRPEMAALALSTGVPIVPAALRGSDRNRLLLGAPLGLERHARNRPASDTLDGYILRGITDTVMLQIAELAQAPYADQYATAGSAPAGDARTALQQIRELRASRRQRRQAEAERRLAESELARLLDEQDQRAFEQAAQAARQQAADAAARWRPR